MFKTPLSKSTNPNIQAPSPELFLSPSFLLARAFPFIRWDRTERGGVETIACLLAGVVAGGFLLESAAAAISLNVSTLSRAKNGILIGEIIPVYEACGGDARKDEGEKEEVSELHGDFYTGCGECRFCS